MEGVYLVLYASVKRFLMHMHLGLYKFSDKVP